MKPHRRKPENPSTEQDLARQDKLKHSLGKLASPQWQPSKPINEMLSKTSETLEVIKLSGENALQTAHHWLPKVESMVQTSGLLRLVISLLGFTLLIGEMVWEFIRTGGKVNPITATRGVKIGVSITMIALVVAGTLTATLPILLVPIYGILLAASSVKIVNRLNTWRKFKRQRRLLQQHHRDIEQRLHHLPQEEAYQLQRQQWQRERAHIHHLLRANRHHMKSLRWQLLESVVELVVGVGLVVGAGVALAAPPVGLGLMLGAASLGIVFAVGKRVVTWGKQYLSKKAKPPRPPIPSNPRPENSLELQPKVEPELVHGLQVANTADIMSDLYGRQAEDILQLEVKHDRQLSTINHSLTIMSQHYEHRQLLNYVAQLLKKNDPDIDTLIQKHESAMTALVCVIKSVRRGDLKDEAAKVEELYQYSMIQEALAQQGILLSQNDDSVSPKSSENFQPQSENHPTLHP